MHIIILQHFLTKKSKYLFILFLFYLFLNFPLIIYAKKNDYLSYYYYLIALYEKDPQIKEEFLKKAIKCDETSLYLKKTLIYIYLENKKFDQAEKLAEDLYKKFPEDRDLTFWLAKIYLLEDRIYKAISILEKFLEKNPKDEKVLGLLISIYLKQKNWEPALTNLNKFIKLEPNNHVAWLFKARVLKKQKKFDEAKKAYLKAYELAPDDKAVFIETLKFLDEISAVKEEEKLLKEYVAKHPENKDILKLLLGFYLENSNWEMAEKLIKKYFNSEPKAPEILFFLGYILENKNKLNEALQIYEKLLYNEKWFNEASRRIIFILKKLKENQIKKYLQKLAKSFKNKEKNKEFYLFLIQGSETLDLCKEGIKYGKEALKIFPEDLDLTLALASNYACIGNYKEIVKIIQPLLEKYPDNPYVLNFLGYTYVELKENLEEAEKLLFKALKLKPEDPYILDSIGWLYYQKGDIDKALEYLEKAINNLPQDEAIIIEHLGDIWLKKGDLNKACEFYNRALKCVIHKVDKKRLKNKIKNCH